MSTKSYRKKEQLNNDEINFDQYLLQLKKIVFKLFVFYNKRISALPRFVIYALTFVEFLQTLFFIVNPELGIYTGDGPFVQAFGSILSYLSAYAFVKMNSGPVNFFLLLATFLWLLFSIFLVYFSYLKIAKPQTLEIDKNNRAGPLDSEKAIGASKLQTFLINMCVGHLLLINSVLAIPYFCIIFPVFYCTQFTVISYAVFSSKQCYNISHIISMGLGLISILIVLCLKAVCIFLIFERNPLKKSIYACHSNISILFKTAGNIVCVWYLMIDPQLMFKPLYIGGLALVYGQFLFIFRWQQVGFYDKSYMNFMLSLEILLLCFAGNNIIQYFFEGGTNLGISFIEFVLASCVMAYSAMSVVNVTKKKMINEFYCGPQGMKKSQQAQNFIVQLIYHLIIEPNKQIRSTNIRVFLKQLDRSIGSKLEQIEPQFITQANNYLQTSQSSNQRTQTIIVYQYFKILLEELINIKSCFMFQALRCAFLFEYGLKTKALCQIYKIEAGKLDWMEEFFLYEIKQRNFSALSDSQEDLSQAFDEIDQQRIIIYDQYISLMSTLEQAIVDSILVNKEFWSQILEEHPDFQYAKKLTNRLSQNHNQILKIHKKISSIFQNSLKEKFLFYSYLQLLERSKDHTQEMIQFLEQNQQHSLEKGNKKIVMDDLNPEKYVVGFEENEKIVMIELEFTSIEGIIKSCNSEIYSFLGYTRNELIGRKIDKLLPGPIAQRHSKFLQNFINRRDSISKSSQRVLYAVHKDRFIVPGFLTIKLISSQQKGLKLVSFIRPLSHQVRSFGLMTTGTETIIVGVTREIMLKIKDEEFIEDIKNESVYLELLFPKLKVEQMKPNEFYEAEMSTLNSIERQFEGDTSTKVFIKYQEKHYQEGLHLRYYTVRLANKVGRYVMGTLAALDMSCHELPGNQVTTTRLIQNFQLKKQQQRRTKMQQLCRFKQNYLSKYNSTKYYMCLIVFITMISGAIWQSVHVFDKSSEFNDSVEWNRKKLENINVIARDLSELESQWAGVERSRDGEVLEKFKRVYGAIVDRYSDNFFKFKVNTESSDIESIFNINILPSKPKRFNSLITIQTQSQQFTEILPQSSRDVSDSATYQMQRNAILLHTKKLLQSYIDQELSSNLETHSKLEEISNLKFIFGLSSFTILAVFSVGIFFAVRKIRLPLDRNLQLIGYLTYSEIFTIVTSFTDYLKVCLSSQLDSIDQFDSIQKMVSESKVFNTNIAKPNEGNRSSNRQKMMKVQKLKSIHHSEGNQDFNDQSSLHFEIHNDTKTLDHQSNFKQPVVMTERKDENQKQKLKNGGSIMKKSMKKFRQSENYYNYRQKQETTRSLMRLKGMNSGTVLDNKGFLKIDTEKQTKKKISFVNESQFTGLELSMQALEKDHQYQQYSHTQIMFRHNNNNPNPHYNSPKKVDNPAKIQRKDRKRLKTRSTVPIELPYPTNYKVIMVCLVMVLMYGGVTYMMYRMERMQEKVLVGYEESINNLIRISGKLMFLRSFLRPYYCQLRDQNGTIIINQLTLSQQIKILQTFTTISFPQLQHTQLILKDIYRDITMYIYLLTSYTPNKQYFVTPQLMPQQLFQSINRIQQNFLLRHEEIKEFIMVIDGKSKEEEKQLKVKYIMEMVSEVLMFFIVLGMEYYLVVWRLKVDERVTFRMVEFFPLRLIAANRSVYKAIKKETSKIDM